MCWVQPVCTGLRSRIPARSAGGVTCPSHWVPTLLGARRPHQPHHSSCSYLMQTPHLLLVAVPVHAQGFLGTDATHRGLFR